MNNLLTPDQQKLIDLIKDNPGIHDKCDQLLQIISLQGKVIEKAVEQRDSVLLGDSTKIWNEELQNIMRGIDIGPE